MWRGEGARDIGKRFPVLMLCLALKWFNGPRFYCLVFLGSPSQSHTWTTPTFALIYDSYLIIVNNFPHCLFLFSWRSLALCGALFKQKGKERGSACQMRETFPASRFSVWCIRSEEKFSLLSRFFLAEWWRILHFVTCCERKKGIWLDYKREELMVKNWGCVEWC